PATSTLSLHDALPICSSRLAATFAKAESGGACPTTGDDAIAFSAAEAAEAETLEAIGAAAATTAVEIRCVTRRNMASSRYAACLDRKSTRLNSSHVAI